MIPSFDFLQTRQNGVGERARANGRVVRTDNVCRPRAFGERAFDGGDNCRALLAQAETIREQHRAGQDRTHRICHVPTRQIRRRAMHGLEEPGAVAESQ